MRWLIIVLIFSPMSVAAGNRSCSSWLESMLHSKTSEVPLRGDANRLAESVMSIVQNGIAHAPLKEKRPVLKMVTKGKAYTASYTALVDGKESKFDVFFDDVATITAYRKTVGRVRTDWCRERETER